MNAPFSPYLILPLLGVAAWVWFVAKPTQLEKKDWSGLLARLGYGLGKLVVAWLLTDLFLLCLNAHPAAKSGWASFFGMTSFTLIFYLAVSGVVDCLSLFRGGSGDSLIRAPFWSHGCLDFWGRWGAVNHGGLVSPATALSRCGLMLILVVAAQEKLRPAMALWLGIHAALILTEHSLGTRRLERVPVLVRGMFMGLIFFLSTPLLYMDSLGEAWLECRRVFNPPADNLYSMFMDQRLNSIQVIWQVWAGILAMLILPNFSWWVTRGNKMALATKAAGVVLLMGSVFQSVSHLPIMPVWVRSYADRGNALLMSDDRAGVVIAANGWLYRRAELDRLTQLRPGPGRVEEILLLQKSLHETGASLLVLPVPDKISLQPEPVLPAKYWNPVLPPGYKITLERLRTAGVEVLEITEDLWNQRLRLPVYFQQDSHWTAEAMKDVAVRTSRHIRQKWPQVVREETPLVRASFMERHDVGDLARRLYPSEPRSFWAAEQTQMVGLAGLPEVASSPVLVIGGDLIQVFDDPDLSFGPVAENEAPAGWAVQLGALIGRALDVCDEADLDEVQTRARDKKLVIWVVRAGEL